jgi:DNA-binding transcriptional MerR regulator
MVKRLRDEYERNKQIKEMSSRDLVIEKLKHFIENGENTDTVKLRAVEILARASGMFVDRVETKNVDRESGEIAAEIESKLAELLREPKSDSEQDQEQDKTALH